MNSLDIEEPEEDEDGRGRRPPKGPPPFLKEAREEAEAHAALLTEQRELEGKRYFPVLLF